MRALVIYDSTEKVINSVQDVPEGITQVVGSNKNYIVEELETIKEIFLNVLKGYDITPIEEYDQ